MDCFLFAHLASICWSHATALGYEENIQRRPSKPMSFAIFFVSMCHAKNGAANKPCDVQRHQNCTGLLCPKVRHCRSPLELRIGGWWALVLLTQIYPESDSWFIRISYLLITCELLCLYNSFELRSLKCGDNVRNGSEVLSESVSSFGLTTLPLTTFTTWPKTARPQVAARNPNFGIFTTGDFPNLHLRWHRVSLGFVRCIGESTLCAAVRHTSWLRRLNCDELSRS